MSATYCFSLPGIRCVNCVQPIEKLLRSCEILEIEDFAVDVVEKKLTVTLVDEGHSPTMVRQFFRDALDDIGVECVDVDLPDESTWIVKKLRSHWFQGFIGTSSGISLLILSLFSGALPIAAMVAIAASSTVLTLLLGAESYIESVKKLFKTGTLTMDTLFSISTLTVLIVSTTAFFIPWLPMMFDAGLLIFGFRHVGLAIEESIKQNMALGVRFKDRVPDIVRVIINETQIDEKLIKTVSPGDLLVIAAGELIPVDGLCEVDEGVVFETILTGSTLPKRVARGAQMLAGMYLPSDAPPMHLRVTAAAKDSYLARLDNHIMRANFEKAPLETRTNEILQYFIPVVILAAALSGVIISNFFPLAIAIQCAVSVLVSACPCTLGFITPLAVKIGMNKAAEHGVQFKSAKSLQEAEQIERVVFDLNGTLTAGIPSVRHYDVMPGVKISPRDLLVYCALLEKNLSHPVAKAICEYVGQNEITPDAALSLTELDASNHSGLSALINGEHYTLGNQTIMAEIGVYTHTLPDNVRPRAGDNVIYLSRANTVLGYIVLSDPLRDDARLAIDSLKALDKEVYICTGADEATALRYASELGIPAANVKAACVGLHKKTYIDELKQNGCRVAMIGDAANDALAIAASDFGIAVNSRGSDEVTQQEAGAVIQSGSLLPIVSAFAVAQKTVGNIKQNLLLSLGYNIAAVLAAGGVLLTVGVTLNPGVGVALMIFQSSLILLNAYRFKQQGLAHLPQSAENVQEAGSYGVMQACMPAKGEGYRFSSTVTDDYSERATDFSLLSSSVAMRHLPSQGDEDDAGHVTMPAI